MGPGVNPTHPWSGWLRPVPGRWKAVASGATWAECWRALLRVEGSSDRNERVVLESHRKPGERR